MSTLFILVQKLFWFLYPNCLLYIRGYHWIINHCDCNPHHKQSTKLNKQINKCLIFHRIILPQLCFYNKVWILMPRITSSNLQLKHLFSVFWQNILFECFCRQCQMTFAYYLSQWFASKGPEWEAELKITTGDNGLF